MEYAEKYLSDDSNVGYELKEVPVARIETATIATTNTTTTNTTASINSNRVILNPTNNLAGLSEAIVDIEHVLYKNCIELNQHEEKLVALLERSEAMEKSARQFKKMNKKLFRLKMKRTLFITGSIIFGSLILLAVILLSVL
uniref:V-SNARE coiled-coil homology domain-containing protein n=1 Tax=Trichobilharzia regenti TaxID=157069 RepID=A0AA85J590_TRIRE|nr:unnamed protein product [Trichobilharzia regenti]